MNHTTFQLRQTDVCKCSVLIGQTAILNLSKTWSEFVFFARYPWIFFLQFTLEFRRLIEFSEFVNRTLVLPYDLGRFDAMVSAHEKEALEYLSGFVPGI